MTLCSIKTFIRVLPYSILTVFILLTSCKETPKENNSSLELYSANWESIKKHYKAPEWFNDAKFGIFIHWGPYSVPAYKSEWYPRQMYMDTASFSAQLKLIKEGPSDVFLHHQEKWGIQKDFGYKDFIPHFKGENFDAHSWIDLFQKAGAKYVIPVADHHDGFAMYKSNTTKWNAYDMGPKRDVLGELFKAGRDKGMIMGASSHFAFNWSYYNKKDVFDTTNPDYQDLYSSKGKNLNEPVSQKFKQRWWDRTKDVIDNYQPDIFWLDFYIDIPDFADMRPKLASYYYNKGIEWNKEVVLQDKNFNHNAFPEGTVIYDLERGKSSNIRKLPWQTDTSLGRNSWCYIKNWETKTANEIIDDLIDIVSKNGNLLLNVGPKADGTIPENQKEILLQVGNWLKINGDAIYNTKHWKTFGEGPTKVKTGHHSEKNNKTLTSKDIRFTCKNNTIYAFLLGWPKEDIININTFAKYTKLTADLSITDVSLLGSSENIKWKHTKKGLEIETPQKSPCKYACTFAISLK